jgi:hypothetical protein
VSTPAHLTTLRRVRWPAGVNALYTFPKEMVGREAFVRRLQQAMGPTVTLVDFTDVFGKALPPVH